MSLIEKNAITRLATVNSVNMNTTDKQSLYTVPTGKICIVTHIVPRKASISLTTANWAYGFNASGNDVVATATHTELTGATLFSVIKAKDGAIRGTAGQTFGSKCTVAQGATATLTHDVFGYLEDA